MMYRIAHYSFLLLLRGVLSSCVVCRYRISISQWKYTNLHPCLSLCCVVSLLSPSIDLLCLGYDIWYCAIVYESLPLITKLSVLLTGPLSTSSNIRIMPIALRVVTKVLSPRNYQSICYPMPSIASHLLFTRDPIKGIWPFRFKYVILNTLFHWWHIHFAILNTLLRWWHIHFMQEGDMLLLAPRRWIYLTSIALRIRFWLV